MAEGIKRLTPAPEAIWPGARRPRPLGRGLRHLRLLPRRARGIRSPAADRSPRHRRAKGQWIGLSLAWLMAGQLAGCAHVAYYGQAVRGQVDLLARREPVARLIADPSTPAELSDRLVLVQAMRTFAWRNLALPRSGSFGSYVELQRPFVVWTVFAAEALSLELLQWCYPFVGCAVYRGFFDRAGAEALAERLRARDYDTYVAGAAAYSTLGWFADPLLSTVVRWPEPELAGLVFHELTHERLYMPGDSTFNESLARTVEAVGVRRWMHHRGQVEAYCRYLEREDHHARFVNLVVATRERLAALYASSVSESVKRAAKAAIIGQLRRAYRRRKATWGEDGRYDEWFAAPLNNAQLSAVATYEAYVPAFQALLARHDGDLVAFFAAAEVLASLEPDSRRAALAALAAQRPQGGVAAAGRSCRRGTPEPPV